MKTEKFRLVLYIAGKTGRSEIATRNLRTYCEQHLKDLYTIEIVDLLEQPQLAEGEQIIAIPTLVRKLPSPVRILVGDLSREHQFLVGMNLIKEEHT
ncbi:MAG TPA: circadian clock KaiB family protein [Mucilaginibacter sp.]|nr:circadian clock KaiB family protein [Mucilaginibacter sp.]